MIRGQLHRDEAERAENQRRERAQAESRQLAREEKRFEAELDALEQEVENQIPLPPETPAEKREAELVRRIEALEGRELKPDAVPLHRDRQRERREYALKDGLRSAAKNGARGNGRLNSRRTKRHAGMSSSAFRNS